MKLITPEPDPPKRPRAPRRRKRHPEARLDEIRERIAASSDVPPTGWRYPRSYVVRVWRSNWTRSAYHEPDYGSAARLMRELYRKPDTYLVVLEQDVG